MDNKKNVKDRLLEFLKDRKMSQAQFEKEIGAGNGFCSRIIDKISSQKLSNIANTFPNLNLEWLQFGRGEMYLDKDATPYNISNNSNSFNGETNIGISNEVLKNQVKDLKNQVEELKNQNEGLQRTVDRLLSLLEKDKK